MSRRLSITVSDDLWDAVSHLDDTQSGVVQKALILLRDEEGEVARTDFEKAAEDIPTYRTALAVLEGYAEDMYQEGYEHLIDSLASIVILPSWIENTASKYSPSKLGQKLADAGVSAFETDHGYCYSIYFHDPNGLQVELTTLVPATDRLMNEAADTAHETLATWLKEEDMASNNTERGDGWVRA